MTSVIDYLELTELSRRIQTREISPVEATTAQLARIENLDGELKSYAHLMAEAALLQARAAEAEIMRGEIRGPLARRADRGEGPVLDAGCPDRRRHDDLQGLPSRRRCHGGAQTVCRRRHHAGQAATDRGRLRRPPSANLRRR